MGIERPGDPDPPGVDVETEILARQLLEGCKDLDVLIRESLDVRILGRLAGERGHAAGDRAGSRRIPGDHAQTHGERAVADLRRRGDDDAEVVIGTRYHARRDGDTGPAIVPGSRDGTTIRSSEVISTATSWGTESTASRFPRAQAARLITWTS